MSIEFECEHCRKVVKAPDSAAGSRGKCPYCGKSSYIPAPVSDEDLLPLAPVDEEDERRQQEEVRKLLNEEKTLWSETGDKPQPPAQQDQQGQGQHPSARDLDHLVVNFCLDLQSSNLQRADRHAQELLGHGRDGVQAVEDFLTGKAIDPALDAIPSRVLRGFLLELKSRLS